MIFCYASFSTVIKSSNSESLLGLIDGAQTIVLTLLVIEIPVLIIEIIEHAESVESVYSNLGIDIVGYFLSAIIIYDDLSTQKKFIPVDSIERWSEFSLHFYTMAFNIDSTIVVDCRAFFKFFLCSEHCGSWRSYGWQL